MPAHSATPTAPTTTTRPLVGVARHGRGAFTGNILTWLSGLCLVVLVILAATAGLLPIPDPTIPDASASLAGPGSPGHILGADHLGRDLLAQVIYGARISLVVGLVTVVIGSIIGGILGLAAGVYKGNVDRVIMIIGDSILAFPSIIFLLLLTTVRGRGFWTVIIGLSVIFVPPFIRLVRASTLQVVEQDFVLAATCIGATRLRVIFSEVVPNVVSAVLAYAFTVFGVAIIAEGTLSFLGLGIPPPTPSWGTMVAVGKDNLERAPHIFITAFVPLVLTVLAFNLLGDWAREHFRGSR